MAKTVDLTEYKKIIGELDVMTRIKDSAWTSFEDDCIYIRKTCYKSSDFEPFDVCFKRFVLCRAEKAEKAKETTEKLMASMFDEVWDTRVKLVAESGSLPDSMLTTKPKAKQTS